MGKNNGQLAGAERTRKYNHLQPSLQRHHPLLGRFNSLYFSCLKVDPTVAHNKFKAMIFMIYKATFTHLHFTSEKLHA